MAAGGGTCTGANECTCNQGFSPPNCEADCSGELLVNGTLVPVNNCGSADGGPRTGWCTATNRCKCDPGFKGADCQTNAGVAKPCGGANPECDEGLSCYVDEALGDGTGICCATACSGECNTCLGTGDQSAADTTRGFCRPKLGGRCGESSEACSVCALDSSSGLGVCGKHSSLCVAQGGQAGDQFGCQSDEFCYEGQCNACSTVAECSSGGKFELDLTKINVKLPFSVCANEAGPPINVAFSAPSGCLVTWQPGSGAGVDCQATDNKISAASADEELLIKFDPPLDRNLVLTFTLTTIRDTGRLYVTHRPASTSAVQPRRRAALQTSTAPAMTSTSANAPASSSTTTLEQPASTTSTTPAPTDAPVAQIITEVDFGTDSVRPPPHSKH
jgi:hypothetical protein